MSDLRFKVYDFVAYHRDRDDEYIKSKLTKLRWARKYQWICDEYRNLQNELNKMYKERETTDKPKTKTDIEKSYETKSLTRIPPTETKMYGWLADQPEFALEVYGMYTAKQIYQCRKAI